MPLEMLDLHQPQRADPPAPCPSQAHPARSRLGYLCTRHRHRSGRGGDDECGGRDPGGAQFEYGSICAQHRVSQRVCEPGAAQADVFGAE